MLKSPDSPGALEADTEVQDTGEVAAAMKNRQIRARLHIIEAFQRLSIPYA